MEPASWKSLLCIWEANTKWILGKRCMKLREGLTSLIVGACGGLFVEAARTIWFHKMLGIS
jgi:hypothetical protein